MNYVCSFMNLERPFSGPEKTTPQVYAVRWCCPLFWDGKCPRVETIGNFIDQRPTDHALMSFSLPPREGPSTVSWVAVMASKDFDGQFFGPRLFPTKIPGMLKIHREIYQVLYVKKQKNTIFVPSSNLGNSIYQQRELCKTCVDSHIHNHGHLRVCFKKHGRSRFFLWRVCFAVTKNISTNLGLFGVLATQLQNMHWEVGHERLLLFKKDFSDRDREHSQPPSVLRFVNVVCISQKHGYKWMHNKKTTEEP